VCGVYYMNSFIIFIKRFFFKKNEDKMLNRDTFF